jgi:hypothetical protein
MNTLPDINQYIVIAWQQLKDAVGNNDWPATQIAFRNMVKRQDLHEKSRQLQQEIADLSQEVSPNGTAFLDRQTLSTVASPPSNARRPTTRPRELRIGSHRVAISINNQISIETANWILNQGKSLPMIPNFVQRTNSGFAPSASTKRLVDGSFIEIGDSQDILIQKARKLLNMCGFTELKLEVLLEDGSLKSP